MSSPSQFTSYPGADQSRHREALLGAFDRVLSNGWYVLGPEVEAFEAEFAEFVGVDHAVGVANGTDAIELLLRAHGIGPGHQVIVPSLTAVATASAVARAGAEPVFADIECGRHTVSPATVAAAMAAADPSRLKAVIAVHLYGHPADIPGLAAICQPMNLKLFEDCAQAHGARIDGRMTGGLADGGAFSFYPTKNLGALGDGGAVATRDSAVARSLRELRQYGWRERYVSNQKGGVNSRLDELQAAFLRVKLPGLPEQIRWRRHLAECYATGLTDLPGLRTPTIAEGTRHAFHLYVIESDHRDDLMAHLQQSGIPVAIHYPAAVHQQPAFFASARATPVPLPETERAIHRILTLPLHGLLSEEAVNQTVAAIRSFTPH